MSNPNFALLPTPIGIKFTDWASVVAEQLSTYGVSVPPDEAQWRDWAAYFSSGAIPGAVVPNPYGFDGWQSWASALIGTIS